MSYILDALKKSDRERQDNSGPTLQTIQRPLPRATHLNSRLILQLVIVVLLFLLALAALWIVNSGVAKSAPQNAVANDVSPASEPLAVVVTEPQTRVTAVELPVLVPFWQLPDTVQQDIPPLTFSLHIYAENPKRRTIIINKNRMTEGDRVLPELQLESITKQGVILNWKKTYRFSIDVVEAW